MRKIIYSPYLMIAFGLFLLFFLRLAVVAFIFFLIGIVMFIERKWPEQWGHSDEK